MKKANVHTLHDKRTVRPRPVVAEAAGPRREPTAAEKLVLEHNTNAYNEAMDNLNKPKPVAAKKSPPLLKGSGTGGGRQGGAAPYLRGTTVRGTGSQGKQLQQPKAGKPTVSVEKGYGKIGMKMGKKGRNAALEAAEKRLAEEKKVTKN
eukprot:TRINITY_DN1053_c0_g1_i1.p1 TRINITY_DN1053_c0_g1~~TRINITY_DN1053_c0_g1_i1.p1  ORF type:complete len:165 (+),score=43.83 TRINITY_DN1053_c0_g1_i1:50-496(+)